MYVIGEIENTATLCKNGIPQSLSSGAYSEGGFTSIFVSNAGNVQNNENSLYIDALWKNGKYQLLNTTPGGCAYGIFVKQNYIL